HEEQPLAPADPSVTRNTPQFEALRTDDRPQASGQPSLRGAIERGGRTAALCLVRPFFYHSRPQPRRNSPLKFAVRPGSAQSVGILPLSPPKPVSAFPLTNRQNANTNPANTSTATHSANPPAHAVPILHGACPRDTAQPAAAAITTPSNPSP